MTYSYSISESTDRDRIRGKIGDNRSTSGSNTDYDFDDETIDSVLVDYPGVIPASIELVRRLIAKASRSFDRSALGLSSSRSSTASQLRELLKDLQEEQNQGAGRIFVGGVSVSANTTQRADTDYEQPAFSIGANDNPGT